MWEMKLLLSKLQIICRKIRHHKWFSQKQKYHLKKICNNFHAEQSKSYLKEKKKIFIVKTS